MRTLVFLSALALVAGQTDTGTCMVNGAEAVSDAMDASMFIWASIARCGHNGETVKCEIGVSSAITSLNSMVNIILGAVDKCGALNTVNKDCGLAISKMTRHVAGIASASGGVTQKCFQGAAHGLNWNHADAAQCVISAKNLAKSLFKVIKAFLKLEKTKPCEAGDTRACAENALQIIGAFSGVGEFLSGTIGHCSPSGAYVGSVCGQQATRLVQQLTTFSERAIGVATACEAPAAPPAPEAPPAAEALEEPTPEERLYSAKGVQVASSPAAFTNVILGAFLPLTAIVAFVGGRFYGLSRASRATREVLTAEI